MKKACFLMCLLPFLPGCWMLYSHRMNYIQHEAEVTLKEGVPCFSPMSDDQVRKEQAEIYSIGIGPQKRAADGLPIMAWVETWYPHISLSGGECIPYGGDTPLERNTLYSLGFGVYVTGQEPTVSHEYSVTFCLLEGKDGETVIWQAQSDEYPTSCPANSVRNYVMHGINITWKDGGVPCFSPANDDQVRKEQVKIYAVDVVQQDDASGQVKKIWSKIWNPPIFLSGNECIPYAGDSPLEKNTLYIFGFGVYNIKYQKPTEEHGYVTTFCLSERKDGKTVVSQFSLKDVPESCPAIPENIPAVKPGDDKSQPQNANSPKEE
jgi:hypothetical protein